MSETYLTVSETATALRCSEATVHRKIAAGELVAHRYGPRLIRVAPGDLAAFVQKSLTGNRSAENGES